MAYRLRQNNGDFRITDSLDGECGDVFSTNAAYVTARHVQMGPFRASTIVLDNLPQSIVDGTEFQGSQIFTFPEGRIHVLGCTATLRQKTTSAILTTLNGGSTGAIGLGTVTASNVALTGTMVDLLPSTAFSSSTVINVAGTAVTAALAAGAAFDGTATAKKIFLNTAYATTTDVDGNATQTISGTIVLTWIFLGDY